MKLLATLLFIFISFRSSASVYLHPIPRNLSGQKAKDFIHTYKTVWLSHNIKIDSLNLNTNGYYIMMAGRINVSITGNIVNRGNNFIGNGDIYGTILNEKGILKLNCLNVTPPKNSIGLDVIAGKVIAQQYRTSIGDFIYAMQVRGKTGQLIVYGGNLRSGKLGTINQKEKGYLHVFGTGFQLSNGADIRINSKSWKGMHLIEGCRSEAGISDTSVFVYVNSKQSVDIILRANNYTANKAAIVSYNASGKLYLIGNTNYNIDKGYALPSVIATAGSVISIGNSLGSWQDKSIFNITNSTLFSIGDMTRTRTGTSNLEKLNNRGTNNITYLNEFNEVVPTVPPIVPISFRIIRNIKNLGIATVEQYGAHEDSLDNSNAITSAIKANNNVLLNGFYRVKKAIEIKGKLGGGIFGIGVNKCGIISNTSGTINVESCGYSTFSDFSLIIEDSNSISTNFNFGWLNKANSYKGSSLQNSYFGHLKIVNGSTGLMIGKNLMGDGQIILNCEFIQEKLNKGIGSSTFGYNVLSVNYMNCKFSGWTTGIEFTRGQGNLINSMFSNVNNGIALGSQVGNAFLFSNLKIENAGYGLMTATSSARTAIIFDNVKSDANYAGQYRQGGSLIVTNSNFSGKPFTLNTTTGNKSFIVDNSNVRGNLNTVSKQFKISK